MAITDKLSAIGNAIRAKTGKSDLMTLEEMPQEISSISTDGGGGGDTSLADSVIDGTVTSYSSDTLTTIGAHAFYQKSNLQTINCPSVSSLGDSAFYNCGSLTQLNIDLDGVTELPASVFLGCSKLNIASFPNVTKAGDSCINSMGSTSIEFPKLSDASAWTALGGSFSPWQQYLQKIKIGTKCTFGYGTFQYQGKLTAVILQSNSLCTAQNSNMFDSTPIASGTGYIYVPAALLEQYKVATNWVIYADQFRAIEDYPDICGTGE